MLNGSLCPLQALLEWGREMSLSRFFTPAPTPTGAGVLPSCTFATEEAVMATERSSDANAATPTPATNAPPATNPKTTKPELVLPASATNPAADAATGAAGNALAGGVRE